MFGTVYPQVLKVTLNSMCGFKTCLKTYLFHQDYH